MKKVLLLISALSIMLFACGVDVKDMYEVTNEEDAQQDTMNVTVETDEQYKEKDLEKIIKDISNFRYDQTKVNGLRLTFLNENSSYAEAKIAFNQTGMNATGVKKQKEPEINIK